MEAYLEGKAGLSRLAEDMASDLEAWFSVSGDMDDFIFYEAPDKPHSEK